MSVSITEACVYVSDALSAAANPEKAVGMQAYMKTDMPFYGVQKPGRTPILRRLLREFPPEDRDQYESLALALWALPHREEKYLAQGVAVGHQQYMVPEALPLFRRMITEGAWWDLVDETATHMVRYLVINNGDETWPSVDHWIDDDDMWLRRSAIICQVGAKEHTDPERLLRFCEQRAFEKEFFIRKAIGWALRDYAKTDAGLVAAFVNDHKEELSGLSFREATRHIGRLVDR
ncbi:MAG: DNA alkylation repair protein [Actinobacteria bacterium]|nr:DNA alkylation repair protein [Actinomycetota bacterium]